MTVGEWLTALVIGTATAITLVWLYHRWADWRFRCEIRRAFKELR